MHYLTVQDVLWIHLQIAKKPGKFSFANLEEATNYQYAYGKSHDVLSQASKFFSGFVAKNPFDSANRAVAFASGIAFLELNGHMFNPVENDMGLWMHQATNLATSKDTLIASTTPNHDAHHAGEARLVARAILEKYDAAIKMMLD
jgi:prophage maintenance system killer protein